MDCHHTIEDVGIALGKAFPKHSATRAELCVTEAFYTDGRGLGICAADISGRPFLVFEASFPEERIGAFDTCMCEEFSVPLP